MRAMLFVPAVMLLCLAAEAASFDPEMATYLGGEGRGEEWTAVDIAPDGTIVVAGTAPEVKADVKETWLMAGGGYGVVLRIDPNEHKIVGVTRMGDYIEDMEVGPEGEIAITGSFGVAVLDPDARAVRWRDGDIVRGTKAAQFRNQTPPFKNERYTKRVARVCIGEDGTVASFQNEQKQWGSEHLGRLYVWNAEGKRRCDVRMKKFKYPKDIAISAKHELVYVGGFNTYSHDSRHMKNHPIHMMFLSAFDYGGREQWAAYDFPANDVYKMNTFADSRVQRLQIGEDGMLYMGGYIHGGDYIWKHDPFDVRTRVKVDTGYDTYSVAANMGRGIDQSYFAQFDPETGAILKGQVLLTRRNPDGGSKPRQIQIKGIDADKDGNVWMAGYCESFIKNRDQQIVAGQKVGTYHKPEIFLLGIAPNWRTRHVWTVFSKKDCEAAAWGFALRDGRGVLLGDVYEGECITTDNAFLDEPMDHTDGYLMYFDTAKYVDQ